MRAVAAGLTDVGLQRDHNEDSFAILQDHELYIVADGMGGHRAGDVASKLATEAIVDFFRATAAEDFTWPFHFDSRMSEEENRQMTRDHSLVNDYLLAMPELTEEQKSELPKNVITCALGMQEHVSVDLQGDDATIGDCYILCSDGLSGMIE